MVDNRLQCEEFSLYSGSDFRQTYVSANAPYRTNAGYRYLYCVLKVSHRLSTYQRIFEAQFHKIRLLYS